MNSQLGVDGVEPMEMTNDITNNSPFNQSANKGEAQTFTNLGLFNVLHHLIYIL
jgi:hypothetical protein